jgi:diguanylate cyclase (GGDEF)-like protein
VNVVLVGHDGGLGAELEDEEGFEFRQTDAVADLASEHDVHAIVIALEGQAPLELLGTLRTMAPHAAILVLTDPDREADGAVAMHAGAEDHLVLGSIPAGLLPRAVRYAVAQRRLRNELATVDELTGLPNLRGFAPIADHHLRMADRARTPVVFLFVRLDGLVEAASTGADEAAAMTTEAAEVLLEAVRDSDVPARIASDTFTVLLTGEAVGAETLVLSRLVEAIATHDAKRTRPIPLSLSVGSALYDPEDPATLSQILETAGHRLHEQRGSGSSETR